MATIDFSLLCITITILYFNGKYSIHIVEITSWKVRADVFSVTQVNIWLVFEKLLSEMNEWVTSPKRTMTYVSVSTRNTKMAGKCLRPRGIPLFLKLSKLNGITPFDLPSGISDFSAKVERVSFEFSPGNSVFFFALFVCCCFFFSA